MGTHSPASAQAGPNKSFCPILTPVMAFCGREWQAAQEQGYIPLLKGTLDTEARVLLGQLGIDEAALDLRKVVEILFG